MSQFLNSQLKFYNIDNNSKISWSEFPPIYLNKFNIPNINELLNIVDQAVKTVKKKEDFSKYYYYIKVFWTTQHDDTIEYRSLFNEGKSTEETAKNFKPLAEILEITKKVNPDFNIRRNSIVDSK